MLFRSIIDSNGNFVVQQLFPQSYPPIDTLGRPFNTDGSYNDSSGALRGLTITNTTAQVLTHMCGFTSIPLYSCTEWAEPATVPQTITFANGMSYSFQYNSYDSVHGGGGEPSSMTLPTGATISWTAEQEGFQFQSDNLPDSKANLISVLGREKNGVLFS